MKDRYPAYNRISAVLTTITEVCLYPLSEFACYISSTLLYNNLYKLFVELT